MRTHCEFEGFHNRFQLVAVERYLKTAWNFIQRHQWNRARVLQWIIFFLCVRVVDIYKLNANVIVSIDHLFPLVPGAWVCFVFAQHFKVKPEKIKSWNHYWERSEHKYFIIWYFLCKIEFMHGDVKAVRIQNYQATVSLYLSEASSHCDGRKFIGTFSFFLLNVQTQTRVQTTRDEKWTRCTSL